MKTKELIRELGNNGFHISKIFANGKTACVDATGSRFSIEVPVDATNWLEIHTCTNSTFNKAQADVISALVTEYLDTPIDERGEEKKYTVQVLKDDNAGFLNQNGGTGELTLGPSGSCVPWRAEFTQVEIEQLKQRDDLAIDWDKAIIKEVHDNENERTD